MPPAVRRSWLLDVGGVVVGAAAIIAALALLVGAFLAPPAPPAADPPPGTPNHGHVGPTAGPASSAGLDDYSVTAGPYRRLTPVVPRWGD